MKKIKLCVILLLAIILASARLEAVEITDDAGQRLNFSVPPVRVVSILPSVTEIICFIDAADSLVGVTYQDTNLEGTARVPVVGSAFNPQFDIINSLEPDLLIVEAGDFQKAKDGRGTNTYSILAIEKNVSLADAEKRVVNLGEIFARRDEADGIVKASRELTNTIELKTAKIPTEKRQKVILLTLGPDGLATPGEDMFQTEVIKAAGGITGKFGDGALVPLTLEALREFSPDFVYSASEESAQVRKFLDREEWRDISAATSGRVSAFPGALINRASAHVGYFTAWLASEIYADEFADASKLVHPQEILFERAVSLDVPYVDRARIVESRIMDFVHRTFLVDFKTPQRLVSTVYGERDGIETAGNSYSPVPTWSVYHKLGFEKSQEDLFGVLGLDRDKADVMLTGADMNNISIKTANFRDMTVTAIVTAGVEGNAIRTSKDTGAWYEPGTINILVLTNHRLSEQAATRAIVTVTEAKTAALWDMDIRSVQTPLLNPATGTGTDTVTVVSGEGFSLNWSGGHSKMGELIADAVYRGVQEALLKQNGKAPIRSVFQRLGERGIFIDNMAGRSFFDLEELLLSPNHRIAQSFLESAFSLSDAYAMGQIKDISSFNKWSLQIAGDIAGRPVETIENIIPRDDLPVVIKTALDALATGLKYRENQ
jgi:adenosylcobinamide amidohydrolase/ABC-type Fe3+-hydroxamate transport system substrate-binding protein